MSIEELQIGDYVKIVGPDPFVGYIGEVTAIDGANKYLTLYLEPYHEHDVFVEDVEDIPLTGEILENSGFEKHSTFHTYTEYRYCTEDERWVFVEIHPKGEHVPQQFIRVMHSPYEQGNLNSTNTMIYDGSVRDLQHLLRMIGIGKEIVVGPRRD